MEVISQIDSKVFLWINGWIGTSATFDRMIHWLVSDYLMPVVCSLTLLGLWFAWRGDEMRERHQRGVILAGVGVGIASAMVKASNLVFFRHRPFDAFDIEMLFYPPTDSSFPANPVAVVVAMATGVWMANRPVGAAMYAAAFVYGFSRVYAGRILPAGRTRRSARGCCRGWPGLPVLAENRTGAHACPKARPGSSVSPSRPDLTRVAVNPYRSGALSPAIWSGS